jgi:phage-related protein
MCFAATNEVATYSNGSLAACRIINAARSPNAVVQFNLKFPIDTSYDKLQVFKGALEEFVRARPREYVSFTGFRCTRVEADLGFVQYIVLASHREPWQNLRTILTSKAELASHLQCLSTFG